MLDLCILLLGLCCGNKPEVEENFFEQISCSFREDQMERKFVEFSQIKAKNKDGERIPLSTQKQYILKIKLKLEFTELFSLPVRL